MLVASAFGILDKRDAAKPRAQQLMVVPPTMRTTVEAARADHDAFVQRCAATVKWCTKYAPGVHSAACMKAASRALRYEQTDAGSEPCVFRGDATTPRTRITLFGNTGGRTEDTFVVALDWLRVVEALIVVGNAPEWIDQMVARKCVGVDVLSPGLVDSLADLQPYLDVYEQVEVWLKQVLRAAH